MGLFNFRKKDEKVKAPTCVCNAPIEESCCCCGDSLNAEAAGCCEIDSSVEIKRIKVLGAGCKSCHDMYENTKTALRDMGIDIEVEYVTEMEKVMAYGIMSMPGLVLNEKVVSMGKVLKPAEIEKLFHKLGY